jgi:hypothetical protein
MTGKESTCALNLRKFPRALRDGLNHFAIDEHEDIQDFVPRWLRERLVEEKRKRQGKSNAKRKGP